MARKISKAVLSLFVVAVIFVGVSLFFSVNKERPIQVKEFDVTFIVQESGIGFDVNSTALTFGALNPGGGGMREINVKNDYSYPVEMRLYVSEDIVSVLGVERSYVFQAGEEREIPVSISIPSDFPVGNYSGTVRFEMYKAD